MEIIDDLEPRGRKRGPGGGGRSASRRPVEEAARSMTPAQLAAEVQKARARAREARFGGGGGGGGGTSSSSSTPLSSAPQPRSLPIGKPAAASSGEPSGAAAPLKRPLVDVAKISDPSRPHFVAPASPSPPPQQQQQQPLPGSKGAFPAARAKVATVRKEASGSSSSSTPPRAVSPVATASATSVPISAAAGRAAAAAPGSSAAAPILVRPDPEEVDTSAPSKTERAAGPRAGTAAEAIPVDETPTDTSAAAPKRPAPTGGDVVVIEPPAKKLLSPPPRTAGSSPPPSSSPRPPAAVPVAGGKTLTLRLRLRTDFAAAEAKQPASTAAPAAASVGEDGAGGVEECKGFKPPNPPPDAGVEECKGFDPPNLSASPAPRLRDSATSPSPTVLSGAASAEGAMPQTAVTPQPKPSVPSTTISLGPRNVVAAAASSAPPPPPTTTTTAAAASRLRTTADGGTPVDASASASAGSWGPSFGIAGASSPAGRTRSVPATPAPSPTAVRPKKNPWILSSEAPTFARNRGRPLAQSFPTPAPAARKSGSGSSGSGSSSSVIDTAARKNPGTPGLGTFSGGGGGGGGGAHGVDGGGSGSGTTGTAKALGGGADVGDLALQAQALPPSSASAGSNLPPPSATQTGRVLRQEVAVDSATAAALAAVTGAGIGAARARAHAAEGVEAGAGAPADAPSGQLVLGVQLGGRAGELLERLRREREESLDFERKLTQALLDL
ncbi:unnamed protein product [Scytosiphon promiscuus]